MSDERTQDRQAGQKAREERLLARCFRCEVSEEYAVLIPCRSKGKDLWVCTHCLPQLIHQ